MQRLKKEISPEIKQWAFITGAAKPTQKMNEVAAQTTKNILKEGGAIVVGASPGIDLITIQTALQEDATANRLSVFLIIGLDEFINYRTEGVDAKKLPERQEVANTLRRLHEINPEAILVGSEHVTSEQLRGMEKEQRQTIYDNLNLDMVRFTQDPQRKGIQNAIGIYFGEGRGTQAAVEKVRGALSEQIFDGMNSEQNPYYSNI